MCWQHYVFPRYWRDRLGTWRVRSGTRGAEKEFPSFLAGKLSCAYSGLVEVASPVLNTHKWVYLPLVPSSPHHEEVRRGFRGGIIEPISIEEAYFSILASWHRLKNENYDYNNKKFKIKDIHPAVRLKTRNGCDFVYLVAKW